MRSRSAERIWSGSRKDLLDDPCPAGNLADLMDLGGIYTHGLIPPFFAVFGAFLFQAYLDGSDHIVRSVMIQQIIHAPLERCDLHLEFCDVGQIALIHGGPSFSLP